MCHDFNNLLSVVLSYSSLVLSELEAGSPLIEEIKEISHAGECARELTRQLLALRPEMKVLYMSGYTEDALGDRVVLDPGIAFLQKPLTPDALLRKLREVLETVSAQLRAV